MSQMIETAEMLVRAGRSHPDQMDRWLNDNAETLIAQQILVASVHAQSSAVTKLPQVLHAWRARAEGPTAGAALDWLKEEHPALLRAWLLSRVEELLADEMNAD